MNIYRNIENFLVSIWARISDISSSAADKITGVIVIEYCLVILFSVLTFAMVMFNWVAGSFLIAFLSSVIIIFCYVSSEAALAALAAIADIVLLGRRKVTTLVIDGIEKVLNPLIVISLIFSFIACVVMMNGTEFITLKLIAISLAAGTFYTIFYTFVRKSRTNKLELWMAIIVAWLLVENVVLPNQVRPVTGWGRSFSEMVSSSINQAGQTNSLKVIMSGATLYTKDFKPIRTVNSDIIAKYMSYECYDKTKEDFNKLILPDNNNMYLYGEEVLVSVRFIKNYDGNDTKERTGIYHDDHVKQFVSNVEEIPFAFGPGSPKKVPLDFKEGDRIEYINPTATFYTEGLSQWYPISGYADHRYTGKKGVRIKAKEYGNVTIRRTRA
ncbi:MAG: hypothetical protein NTY12_03945 [Candidatus Falkowbacteria bacterium]|nr:hypothetical protein [Candidatus Falkowbacteria bacterium]